MKAADFELRITSKDLDCSLLRVHRVRVEEHMSKLFAIDLEIVAMNGALIDLDEASGAVVTITVVLGDEELRRFTGMITRIIELPVLAANEKLQFAPYRLEVRPRAWLSTLVETLDIHLDTTVPAIVESKLSLFDLQRGADFELNLSHEYPSREMTVQYKETDEAFFSRLCEHWGIFFYFDHSETDRIVFGDDVSAYMPIAGEPEVAYRARGEKEGVFELRTDRSLITKHYVCRDYNDQTPSLELHSEHTLDQGFGGGVIEYGSDFRTPAQGDYITRVRAEERLCTRHVFEGNSDQARFSPGHVFRLEDHPRHNRDLLLVSVVHEASQEVAGWGAGSEIGYRNTFRAIDAELCYRPPRTTAVPRIHGLVTGVIETSQGALEKYAKIDDQGRYTVRFLFDTAAPNERQASCQVRMMQTLAGPGYGVHFPLKPGTEVSVAFVDGNPDLPIIVGAVPNPITRIKTRAGIVIEFEDADRG
jgi:type VI secretion system secreted protein VgrG